MYTRIVSVTKLPTTSIDLNTIYELQYNDFYRPAGTKWSYSLTLGWFENDLDLSNTALGISIDASGFDGNLDPTVDTVQELAQKVDDLVIPSIIDKYLLLSTVLPVINIPLNTKIFLNIILDNTYSFKILPVVPLQMDNLYWEKIILQIGNTLPIIDFSSDSGITYLWDSTIPLNFNTNTTIIFYYEWITTNTCIIGFKEYIN